ncbi:transmembrane and ubiquitin-like domain-containing protein 2 [Carassius gibelio]|uniref:transmembrane and ubiquitin-like domain-containing protein 2 n=1 Tax=Carassius gibelio TaxID=101364 RepID=UPI0022796E6B|nr:transmembrane and ubiquitin-like domain-containing protein 2 [Carassius gibelio]XP_052400112.1 transmembrane and ubiquitin-like domain-containing protein 2 [Carassius gibelio]XP_052400120.1 transmembrane and ubiquitin-like domain-containing protein 2 [Carassius gibelio]
MAVCALTVLDGLGEEATALGSVVVLFLAVVLAWLSTHVADRGDHILGTILTVGAHASLIGLGGHDSYANPPPSSEPSEQLDEEPAEEEKQEEGEDGREDVPGEELLDIQGGRKKVSYVQAEEREEGKEEGMEEEAEDEASGITVRLKFLNDTEELAVLRPQDTVGLLKSKYFSGREHQIKLIYQGQLLQDPQRSLLSLNITHNSVLHCHVSQAQALREAAAEESPRAGRGSVLSGGLRSAGLALSTGSLVIPVFVVLLAVIWYFRINYRQLFTAPATISLVGVTVFFSFLIFGMHSR